MAEKRPESMTDEELIDELISLVRIDTAGTRSEKHEISRFRRVVLERMAC